MASQKKRLWSGFIVWSFHNIISLCVNLMFPVLNILIMPPSFSILFPWICKDRRWQLHWKISVWNHSIQEVFEIFWPVSSWGKLGPRHIGTNVSAPLNAIQCKSISYKKKKYIWINSVSTFLRRDGKHSWGENRPTMQLVPCGTKAVHAASKSEIKLLLWSISF